MLVEVGVGVMVDVGVGDAVGEGVGVGSNIFSGSSTQKSRCALTPHFRRYTEVVPFPFFHQFKHPMKDRLTDEKWRDMLKSGPPEQPEWTTGYRVP